VGAWGSQRRLTGERRPGPYAGAFRPLPPTWLGVVGGKIETTGQVR